MESKNQNVFQNNNQPQLTEADIKQFLIHRELQNNEFEFQEIKAEAKLCKRTIGLLERAVINDQKKGLEVNKDLVNKIANLKEEQKAIDMKQVSNRNPDNVMLHVYIDLHGCGKEQGKRILWEYLRNKQEQLCKGQLQPNRDSQTHIVQVITGPGELELAVKDFMSMAGYSFFNKNGAFLVRLTTNHQDANANMARVGLNKEMLKNKQAAWENEKIELQKFKKQRREEAKADKKAEKDEFKAQKKEEKMARKAEKEEVKAQKFEEKMARKAEKAEAKALKFQNKAGEQVNQRFDRKEVKLALKGQGFTCFQIKQIRFGLGDKNASLQDCETYAADNNIRPAKVTQAAARTQQPQEEASMKSNTQ